MTDGIICDRCEEAVESKKHKRGLRMTVESKANSKAATSHQSAEFDLCEDCSHEFHEWADIRKPRGYRDDEEDAEADDESASSVSTIDTRAEVEHNGAIYTLDGVEYFIETDHGEVSWAEFSGYVREVTQADE